MSCHIGCKKKKKKKGRQYYVFKIHFYQTTKTFHGWLLPDILARKVVMKATQLRCNGQQSLWGKIRQNYFEIEHFGPYSYQKMSLSALQLWTACNLYTKASR